MRSQTYSSITGHLLPETSVISLPRLTELVHLTSQSEGQCPLPVTGVRYLPSPLTNTSDNQILTIQRENAPSLMALVAPTSCQVPRDKASELVIRLGAILIFSEFVRVTSGEICLHN